MVLVIGLVYFAGKEDYVSKYLLEKKPPKIVKKNRAVKSQSVKDNLKEIEPAPKPKYDYTFFDTLKDVELARYVDLNGKVVKKKVEKWVDQFEEAVSDPQFVSDLHSRINKGLDNLLIENASQSADSKSVFLPQTPPINKKYEQSFYIVQVSSYKEISLANELGMKLKNRGFPIFITRVRDPKSKTQWHRVSLGKYKKMEDAQKAASDIRLQYSLRPIVVKMNG